MILRNRLLLPLLAILTILIPFAAFAQPTSLEDDLYESLSLDIYTEHINDFIVDIDVQPDGSIDVLEKIQYDFGATERHGIFRQIPMAYGEYPEEIYLDFEIYDITDENGVAYNWTNSGTSYLFDLKIGDPDITITGEHWYYISYSVDLIVNGFSEHDEIYWNVTGNQWEVPILHSEVNVKIPEGSNKAANQAICFTGYLSSQSSTCTAEATSAREFHFETTAGLQAYSGLTIAAGFKKDISTPASTLKITSDPSYADIYVNGVDEYSTPYFGRVPAGTYSVEVEETLYHSYTEDVVVEAGKKTEVTVTLKKTAAAVFYETYLAFILAGLIAAAVYMLWYLKGRDPTGRTTVIAEYEPPHNLSPGEVGVVVDEKAHLHDITASVIHLAVNGYLKIKKEDKKKKFKWGKQEYNYTFIKLKEADKAKDLEDLEDFEKKIFKGIFSGTKKEVKLSALQYSFYSSLPGIKKALYKAVVDKGYFKRAPDKVRSTSIGLGIVAVIVLFSAVTYASAITESGWYLVLSVPLAVEIIVVAAFMARKTKKGAEAHDHIKGFKLYLKTAEKARLDFHQSPEAFKELFEKYLPYAVALEVEEEWAEQFKDLYDQAPDWYEGGGTFTAMNLINSIGSMNAVASKTFVSRPGSSGGGGSYSGWSGGSSSFSGGSGFSGGGYSGGGFGGGGGSSW